mmetsp:Transcript_52173/g.135313  ORF Transcript_52173/g.135313 Transcript_52173/m.135313 type:complete len:322 (+) Transcript_52173:658-1623(+)
MHQSQLTHCAVLVWQIEHIHHTFPHLIDARSFSSWAPHFREFADAFVDAGIPIPNLIGFIDGKLWPVCRPGRYQHILYSGHKRIHGLKTQGIVFPNGVCAPEHACMSPTSTSSHFAAALCCLHDLYIRCIAHHNGIIKKPTNKYIPHNPTYLRINYPLLSGISPFMFGPVNGARHDSTVLRRSNILQVLHDICRGGPLAWPGAPGGLGEDFALFGDSAYPLSTFLWRMYKGVMQAWQRAFNRDMSPERVSVEWGFGKMVNLWPFLDYRKKHKVLQSPVGRHFAVGNILTNIHTILSGGNIISRRYGLSPPMLDRYISGGPY